MSLFNFAIQKQKKILVLFNLSVLLFLWQVVAKSYLFSYRTLHYIRQLFPLGPN